MKTHILQLEPHDDIVSTRDKMGWGKAGRILLVWPERSRLLTRRLDLALLQRHSAGLGAQLALVSRDAQVRFNARLLGIPVFKSLRQAQGAHWRTGLFRQKERSLRAEPRPRQQLADLRPPEERPLPLAARAVFFTLGVLALLSIAAVLAPSARIQLAPKVQAQSITVDLQASPQFDAYTLSGRVPSEPRRVVVEGRERLPVSGSAVVPDQPATGRVVFTNLTDQAVPIPEGSVARTLLGQGASGEPVRFATTRAGTVPSGIGQTLELPVRALTLGRRSNLGTGSLRAIEGDLGLSLSVTNPQPTTGGKDRSTPAPSATDRARLEASLLESLRRSAERELQSGLATNDVLIPASLALSRTLEKTFEPEGEQPATELTLSLRVEFQALAVSGEDLRALAGEALDAGLPPGYTALPGDLHIESLSAPELDADLQAHWEARFSRQIEARLAENQAVMLAMGQAPDQAAQRLSAALPLASAPGISLTPAWWPRLPVVPFRIVVSLPR